MRRSFPRLKEPFPAASHWLGAVLSLAGLMFLLARAAGRPWFHVAALAVYGVTLVLLYVASALAHSVDPSPEVGARFDRFDYAAIFLLIAGSYTPFCVIALPGPWGFGLLAAVWATGAVGIAGLFTPASSRRSRVIAYVAMGWIGLAGAIPLLRALPPAGVAWVLAGGLIYTLGSAVFFTDRPHLWPGRFAAHDLWHCMVLAGSACHFVAVARYVAPAGAV